MDTIFPSLNDAVARQVKAEKAVLGLSTAQLAERAGLGERTLYRYLECERKMPFDVVERLARAVDMTVVALIQRASDERLDE